MDTKYTKEVDAIIYSTIANRGGNTVDSAALEARKAIFAATNKKLTLPMVRGRYYTIRKYKTALYQQSILKGADTAKTTDVREIIVDMLMSRENVTLEIQGKQITAVFK